jgi:hypothetical protein
MTKVDLQAYAVWQRSLFWIAWLALLIPLYFIGHGFALAGSLVFSGYGEIVDVVLILIFGTAILEVLLIGIYTLTRFRHQGYSFKRLLLWLMLGIAGIPLAALLGSLYAYLKLTL